MANRRIKQEFSQEAHVLEDIANIGMGRKAEILLELFSWASVQEAKIALEACSGDLDSAADFLLPVSDAAPLHRSVASQEPVPNDTKTESQQPEGNLLHGEASAPEKAHDNMGKSVPQEVVSTQPNRNSADKIIIRLANVVKREPGSRSYTPQKSPQCTSSGFEQQNRNGVLPRMNISTRTGHSSDVEPLNSKLQTSYPDSEADPSIDSITDKILRQKVEELQVICPLSSIQDCLNTLQICNGHVEEAADLLLEPENEEVRSTIGRRDASRDAGNMSENSARNRGKRKTVDPDERAQKRSRVQDNEDGAASLPPASEWVQHFLSLFETSRITISLDGGRSIRKVPKRLLYDNSDFFKERFDRVADVQPWAEEKLDFRHINSDTFDLALQWIVCKNVALDFNLETPQKISALLDFVLLAKQLIIRGTNKTIATRLTRFLIEDRHALRGSHIRKVYELEKGNAIRDILVKAAVMPRMVFTQAEFESSDESSSSSDELLSPAHRAALSRKKPRSPFQKELDEIPDFKEEFTNAYLRTMDSKERRPVPRRRNQHMVFYTDPFNDQKFTI